MRLRLTTKTCSLTKVHIEIQSEVEKDEPWYMGLYPNPSEADRMEAIFLRKAFKGGADVLPIERPLELRTCCS